MSKIYVLLILVLFLVIVGPLVVIWSLNTLFPVLMIPYGFETWLAVFVITGIFRENGIFLGKKSK